MLDKLATHSQIGWALHGQCHCNLQHVLAEERHPGRAVGLLQVPPGREWSTAIEDPDIVQSQEASFKHVPAGAVLAIYPPGEVQQQLLEGLLEPLHISLAALGLFETIGEDRRPGM